ncbi:MAG: hypothetical protein AAGG75_19395 [Bacteroidota bacterium]
MKPILPILLSLYCFCLVTTSTTAQSPYTPMTITVDEANPAQTAQNIIDSLQAELLNYYPTAQQDLTTIITYLSNAYPLCPRGSVPSCRANPDPSIVDLPTGDYQMTFQGLTGNIGAAHDNNFYVAYLRFDNPSTPSAPNFSVLETHLDRETIDVAHSIVANSVIFIALLAPNGRSDIQAIIIADKYILRSGSGGSTLGSIDN